MPLPRPRLLALVLIAAFPLALAAITPAFAALAALVLMAAAVLAIVDFRATPSPSSVPIERVAEPQLSIGVGNRVAVRLRDASLCITSMSPKASTSRRTVIPSTITMAKPSSLRAARFTASS